MQIIDPTCTCPPYYQLNSNNKCECVAYYPCYNGRKRWDCNECKCVCRFVEECSINKKWNPNTCQCECLEREPCYFGKEWDDDECRCKYRLIRQCHGGKIWSSDRCTCLCPEDLISGVIPMHRDYSNCDNFGSGINLNQ